MPQDDGLTDKTPVPVPSGADDNELDVQNATARLTQEARKAMTFANHGQIRDVTADFITASSKLKPGQLVKDDGFTLFEAVGALEIMDPKMDSGYVPQGDTFESTFDVCQGRDAPEILWIMDELMCLEMAWHDGNPLSQTVFMSLHIDRLLSPDNRQPYTFLHGDKPPANMSTPEQLVHNVLRPYCIALVKCCQAVLDLIQSQNFYDEEDFVTHLFGRELLPRVDANEAVFLIDDALSWLPESSLSDELHEAIEVRLQFRREALLAMSERKDHWEALVSLIQTIDATRHISNPILDAFSEKVQRQLATSTPPRPMLKMSWETAYKKWTNMCTNIISSNALTTEWICQSANCLQRSTWAFAYNDPAPNAFSRAHFQDRLFGTEHLTETTTFFDLFLTDLRDLVLAGDPLADPESFQIELTSDPRHLSSRLIESWMDKAFEEYLNLYRMVCQNRCRIRRTFTQSISILDGLQIEAKMTDDQLIELSASLTLQDSAQNVSIQYPLSQWTAYQKLRIMAWTIQLGFETEIYLPDELCMMYWLLNDRSQRQREILSSFEPFNLARLRAATAVQHSDYANDGLASRDLVHSHLALANVTRLLSHALFHYTALLLSSRAVVPPSRPYASDALLWATRMKPYLGVVHDPVPDLAAFQQARREAGSVTVAETRAVIAQDVADAKRVLAELKRMTPRQAHYEGTEGQWAAEIRKLETTCVAVVVQTTQLVGRCEAGGPELDLRSVVDVDIPEPAKRYHIWWVVPAVKAKA